MSKIVATYTVKVTLREPNALIPDETALAAGLEPVEQPASTAPTVAAIVQVLENILPGYIGFEVNASGERTDQ